VVIRPPIQEGTKMTKKVAIATVNASEANSYNSVAQAFKAAAKAAKS